MAGYELEEALAEKAGLTGRQRECLELWLRGASHRYIARQLGIRHSTVQEHLEKAGERIAAVLEPGEKLVA